MSKNIGIIAVILLVLSFVIFYFLPDKRGGSQDSNPARFFSRSAKLVDPPDYAVRNGRDFRVTRWLDRIMWGTSASINGAIERLALEASDPGLCAEVVRRVQNLRSSSQTKAKLYLDLLSEMNDPAALPTLIECTADSSSMIRVAALKGVARFDTDEAIDCLLEHAFDIAGEPNPASLDLLTSKKHPKVWAFFEKALHEGIPGVVHFALRSPSLLEQPSAREILQSYLQHEDFEVRSVALQALLTVDDPLAFEQLQRELADPRPVIKRTAISMINSVLRLPDAGLLEDIAKNPDPEVRLQLARELVALTARFDKEALKPVRLALVKLVDDSRPEVRLEALEGLYKIGREEIATPFLRRLETAYGGELGEAVSFITELDAMRDTIIDMSLRRLKEDDALQGPDRFALLSGLAEIEATEAIPFFFELIRGKRDARRIKADPFTLDVHAALKVHNLSVDILPQWLDAFAQDPSDTMAYLFLIGIRNLENPDAAEPLLNLARDKARPGWIRREAILSFAFLKSDVAGEKLLAYSDAEVDPELSNLATKLFWNFF